MTSKLTINDHRLAEIHAECEERDPAIVEIRAMIEELQERRKADSEPAIIVGDDGGDALAYRRLIQSFSPGTKLYRHAPPAPVVPDSRVITQHFDTIALETAREIMCDVNRRGDFLGGDTQLLSRIQCRIDTACRAAMLQAGDFQSSLKIDHESTFIKHIKSVSEKVRAGNSPAHSESRPAQIDASPTPSPIDHGYRPDCECAGCKATARICAELAGDHPVNCESRCSNSPVIPDGWIPVSERIPDETQPVIVVSEGGVVQRTVYQFFEGVWSDWYDLYDDVNVEAFTHWMPLPAAPQEVK